MSPNDLTPEEHAVLAALRAGDSAAAESLAALDDASRLRVVAHLSEPAAAESKGPSAGDRSRAGSSPPGPDQRRRWGTVGWGLALVAVAVLAAGAYGLLSLLTRDDAVPDGNVDQAESTTAVPDDLPGAVPATTSHEESGGDPPAADRPAEAGSSGATVQDQEDGSHGSAQQLGVDEAGNTAVFVAVSAGWAHSCGLRAASSVVCWGDNEHGQAAAPAGEFVTVSSGGGHSCGLRPDGTATCWGSDEVGGQETPSDWFSAISTGRNHSCGLRLDGSSILCWTYSDNDAARNARNEQIQTEIDVLRQQARNDPDAAGAIAAEIAAMTTAIRTNNSGYDPVYPETLEAPIGEFTSVSAGWSHSCALRDDRVVICWGDNSAGQLDAPMGEFVGVSAGGSHSCALQIDGAIVCWGESSSGQLDSPAGRFVSVSAGGGHTCGLRTGGEVVCWGENEYGQADSPDGEFSAVSTGDRHSCGLLTSGRAVCWGWNASAEIDVPSGDFVSVTAGTDLNALNQMSHGTRHHSCGLRPNGSMVCWGDNQYGKSDALEGEFRAVTAGSIHSCGLRFDGRILCWGSSLYDIIDAPEGDFISVSVGWSHSCGIRSDREVLCWGVDSWGQPVASPPVGSSGDYVAVSAGGLHSCGLRADGQIVCWGDNSTGQADAPLGEFAEVSAGGFHTCGLRVSGEIVCWGWNNLGQAEAPVGEFAAVSAGGLHSCGLRAGGKIVCWGWNDSGQADAPVGEFKAVSAGGVHTCGLRVDGEVVCWSRELPTPDGAQWTDMAEEEAIAEEEPVLNGVAHFPGETKVAVVNGTGIRGLAGTVAQELNALGYITAAKSALNQALKDSVVYFRPGYGADAVAIADALDAPLGILMPAPAEVLTLILDPGIPEDLADFDVFLFLGTDGVV